MLALTATQLNQQKAIFEETLVKEILAELRFFEDKMGGRAINRPGFAEKLIIHTAKAVALLLNITGAATSIPLPAIGISLSMAGIASDVVGSIANIAIEYGKDKRIKKVANISFTDVKHMLEISLFQFAKAASLRYEYLLAVKLSNNPAESVIPLARIGARRVVEFLCRHLDDGINDLKDINILLDGLIQGHSGKYVDGFKNNSLIAKHKQDKHLTAEGALGRSAMRVIGDMSHMYYRTTKQEGKHYSWGKTAFKRGSTDKTSKYEPKYGYIFVDNPTRQRYGYQAYFDDAINQNDEYQYQSRVYLASKDDIVDYLTNKKPQQSFLHYIQKVHPHISEIWVKNIAFDNMDFKRANFTGIDFSGCSFTKVNFDQVDFSKVNFAFVTMQEVVCQQVSFNQADFSFAYLKDVSFKQVSHLGAQWLGAQLEDIKDDLVQQLREIEQIKQQQKEVIDTTNEQFANLHQKLIQIEQEQTKKLKALEDSVYNQSTASAKQAQDVHKIAQQNAELIINTLAHKDYCEAKLKQVDVELNMISSKQAEHDENSKSIIQALQNDLRKLRAEITQSKQQLTTIRLSNSDKVIKEIRQYIVRNSQLGNNNVIEVDKMNATLMDIPKDRKDLLDKAIKIVEDQSMFIENIAVENSSLGDGNQIRGKEMLAKPYSYESDDETIDQVESQVDNLSNRLQELVFKEDGENTLNPDQQMQLFSLLVEQENATAKELKKLILEQAANLIDDRQKLYLISDLVKPAQKADNLSERLQNFLVNENQENNFTDSEKISLLGLLIDNEDATDTALKQFVAKLPLDLIDNRKKTTLAGYLFKLPQKQLQTNQLSQFGQFREQASSDPSQHVEQQQKQLQAPSLI